MTRWAEDDLTGRLLKAQTEPKPILAQISFLLFCLLATQSGLSTDLEELETIKSSVPIRNTVQYMQNNFR